MSKLDEYSLNGLKHQKDENNNVKQEYKPYLLRKIMEDCVDFKEEKSEMEFLFEQLSMMGENTITLLATPKCHPEIAGEGIEYAWGFFKRMYRSILLKDKKVKVSLKTQCKKVLVK